MYRRIMILGLISLIPFLLGCPGASTTDKSVNKEFWAWVEQNDAAGWQIPGFPDAKYQNIIVDHKFKPTRVLIIIKGDQVTTVVNPIHQRNLMDNIAMEWWKKYPANMKPRFNLRVEFYNTDYAKENQLGWTEIDQDGTPETHHFKTQDTV